MESTLFQVGKKPMFLQLVKNSMYNFHVWLAYLLNINQNIVQTYYDKDIKLFNKDLIDIILKIGRGVGELKWHDLVLKMAVPSTKNSFSFITLSNPHLIVGINQVQLSKVFGLI